MFHIDRTDIQAQLRDRGIDPDHIRSLHIQLQTGELDHSSFVVSQERLRAPTQNDVRLADQLDQTQLTQVGRELMQQDRLLVFWLSGGAATRYFDRSKITEAEWDRYGKALAGVDDALTNLPKGVTPVINHMSYLELKVRNLLLVTKQFKLEVHPQVVLMTSFLTDEPIRLHLDHLFQKYPDLDPGRFHFVVQQPFIPRFQKVADLKNIDLFIDNERRLSFAPCGHGDFIYLLQEYLREHHIPQVQYMFFANVDNLAATISPWLLGAHVAAGRGRTVELVEKQPGDQGGAPCFVDDELIILEQMKFPPDFDQNLIPWFNTNTFWFSIDQLLNFTEDLPLILAEKTLPEGDVIQLEHFACDVHLPSQYIVLPRDQRFWPVKRYVDLLIYQDPQQSSTTQRAFVQLLQTAYDIISS